MNPSSSCESKAGTRIAPVVLMGVFDRMFPIRSYDINPVAGL